MCLACMAIPVPDMGPSGSSGSVPTPGQSRLQKPLGLVMIWIKEGMGMEDNLRSLGKR